MDTVAESQDGPIPLVVDDMRTGMMLTDEVLEAHSALQQALKAQHKFIGQMRVKYGVGNDWTVKEWLIGLERKVEGG